MVTWLCCFGPVVRSNKYGKEDITEQDCSFNGGQEAEWDKMVQKQNISLKDWSQWLFPPNSPHLFTITQLQIYQQYDPFMRLALS